MKGLLPQFFAVRFVVAQQQPVLNSVVISRRRLSASFNLQRSFPCTGHRGQ